MKNSSYCLFFLFLLFCISETKIYSQSRSGIYKIRPLVLQEDDKILGADPEGWKGSGFLFSYLKKDYILTAAHVIDNSGNGTIMIDDGAGHQYETIMLGGDTFFDIAVLSFKDKTPLPEITRYNFVNSEVHKDEWITITGEAGKESIDCGISNLRTSADGVSGNFRYIEASKAAKNGWSGAPTLTRSGEVAGVNARIQDDKTLLVEGKLAFKIAKSIIESGGVYERAYMGVLFSQKKNGVFIEHVLPRNPDISDAISAIQLTGYIGWQVTQLNGKKIYALSDVIDELEVRVNPNEIISITLKSGNSVKTIKIWTSRLSDYNRSEIAYHFLKNYLHKTVTQDGKAIYIDDNKLIKAGLYDTENGSVCEMYAIPNMAKLGVLFRLCTPEKRLNIMIEKNGKKETLSFNLPEPLFYF